MNLPNKLTIFRICLVPLILIVPYLGLNQTFLNIPLQNWLIIIIFGIASYTDHLDGKIARKNHLITTFGKFADPLADKILVLTAMIILVEMQKLPAWIPVIILTREFIVSGYRLVAVQKNGEVIAANFWGKIKTTTQMIAILLAFIDLNSFAYFCKQSLHGYALAINLLSTIIMALSVIATVISGWKYVKNWKELFKN
jgi:CDP-diacylglycerol--glycerol-3-phosphate 3-phosphatidyltransferase